MLVRGEIVTLRFDARNVIVWWGPDAYGADRVAMRGGRVRTWKTAGDCDAAVRAAGWSGLTGGEVEQTQLDFSPAQRWLQHGQTAVDAVSALNLWNMAGDIAASADLPWPDGGFTADCCYEKLCAADLSHLVGPNEVRLRWSTHELRRLRTVLNDAVHVLRIALR